jgi:hypothetical protein
MEVPHRYPYNSPVSVILLLFGCGTLLIAVEWLSSRGHFPNGFHLWFGLILIASALIVGVHRILVKRYLLLDQDGMVLPIGPFTRRTAKIEYTTISRVWRHYFGLYNGFVLKVATDEQAFKILPTFLPGNESYSALEEFLNCKLLENARARKSSRN